MALSTPVQGTSQLNFNRSGTTTLSGAGAYTPPGSTLICVVVAIFTNTTTNSLSIADTWGGLSWSQKSAQSSTFTDPGSGVTSILTVAIFTAITGASPSSGTYTVTSTNAIQLSRADVYTIAGADTSGPVGTSGTSNGTNTGSTTVNETLTLGATPATTSMTLALLGAVNNVAGDTASAPTDDAAFTRLEQVGIASFSNNDWLVMDVSYDLASPANSLTWGLPGSQNIVGTAGAAVEILVAPPPPPPPPPPRVDQRAALTRAASW